MYKIIIAAIAAGFLAACAPLADNSVATENNATDANATKAGSSTAPLPSNIDLQKEFAHIKRPANQAEFDQTSAKLDKECSQNNAKSCHELADLIAVIGEAQIAFKVWDYVCATHSYGPSCMRLAWAFQNGFGIEKSEQNAQKVYEIACDKGLKEACIIINR